ncbi:site-specific integrase [Peptostreptococcus sp.]|uniref:site-specific integrase n=1 Tax=Peptostreptococcus sp. TaxID=1262 RepID=UPI001DDAB800|nr:site-specific integrase [Peptostreptococcus sp.]MBS5596635.1 tyrosine-type recombinase/integrase [Peptostreptococcus sp.]
MPAYKDKVTGNWYASFYCRGKKHLKRGFKTQKAAKNYENQYKAIKEGSSEIKFCNLWDEYMKACEGVYKASSLHSKQYYYDAFIADSIGDMRVVDIESIDIKTLTDNMLEDNRSKKTCNSVIQQINACISWGKDYYKINNVERFKCFKITVKERNIWTPEQFNTFLSRIDDFEYYVAFSMLFWLGLRDGELLALTVGDIKGQVVSITKTYSYIHRISSTPKTNSSRREVTMPIFIAKMVHKLIEMKYEPELTDRLLSFDNPSNFRYYLTRYGYGLPKVTAHDLRHSHASYLIKNNVDIVSVSRRLGHSNPSITLKTYAHAYNDHDSEVAEFIDTLKKTADDELKNKKF